MRPNTKMTQVQSCVIFIGSAKRTTFKLLTGWGRHNHIACMPKA